MNQSELKFPLVWKGRLIVQADAEGTEGEIVRAFACLGLSDGTVGTGSVSSKGSYRSWSVQATVPDLVTLRSLFKILESLPKVKMLI